MNGEAVARILKWVSCCFCAVAAMLQGCTYLDPHISPDTDKVAVKGNMPLPQVERSVAVADEWYRAASKKGTDVT